MEVEAVLQPGCPPPQPLPRRLLAGEPQWLAAAPGWLLRGAAGRPAAEAASALASALERWLRGRTCGICGARASLAAARWLLSPGEGLAVLEGLVPLCPLCRLSYWPGEAAERGLLAEARRRYARSCGTPEPVEEALRGEARLAAVPAWRVRLSRLPEVLSADIDVAALEEASARLAAAPWLPGWDTVEASGRLADAASLAAATAWLHGFCHGSWSPARVAEEAAAAGLGVDAAAVERVAAWLRSRGVCAAGLGEALEALEGYWAVALSAGEAEKLVRVAERLASAPWSRLQLPLRGLVAAKAWTPVALDAHMAAEALAWLEDLLGRPLEAVYRHAATGAVLYTPQPPG